MCAYLEKLQYGALVITSLIEKESRGSYLIFALNLSTVVNLAKYLYFDC